MTLSDSVADSFLSEWTLSFRITKRPLALAPSPYCWSPMLEAVLTEDSRQTSASTRTLRFEATCGVQSSLAFDPQPADCFADDDEPSDVFLPPSSVLAQAAMPVAQAAASNATGTC